MIVIASRECNVESLESIAIIGLFIEHPIPEDRVASAFELHTEFPIFGGEVDRLIAADIYLLDLELLILEDGCRRVGHQGIGSFACILFPVFSLECLPQGLGLLRGRDLSAFALLTSHLTSCRHQSSLRIHLLNLLPLFTWSTMPLTSISLRALLTLAYASESILTPTP